MATQRTAGRLEKGCPYCGRALAQRSLARDPTCDDRKCRSQWVQQLRDQRRAEDEAWERDHRQRLARLEQVRSEQAAVGGVNDAASYTSIVLPSNRLPLAPLSPQRRERFAQRLAQLIAQTPTQLPGDAADETNGEDPRLLPLLPVLGAACGTCGGHCCRNGGEHAFLDQQAIWRYRAAHLEASDRGIVEAYVCQLPEKTYSDSCVYHTEAGCALPREMRSATCNSALCSGLRELRDRMLFDGERRFFLVSMRKEETRRAQFIDGQTSIHENKFAEIQDHAAGVLQPVALSVGDQGG